MHRTITTAAIGLFAVVAMLAPISPAFAIDTSTTAPATTSMSSTTTQLSPTTATSTAAPATTGPRSTAPKPAAGARAAGDRVVNIVTNATTCASGCFSPENTTIEAGDTVTWTNNSSSEHTIDRCTPPVCSGASGGTGSDPSFGSAHFTLAAGASAHFTFTRPGPYVYYCKIHTYALMHGTITVTAAAPTTTVATATTLPAAAPVPTVAAQPELAHTGANTNGSLTVALILIGAGLTALTSKRDWIR